MIKLYPLLLILFLGALNLQAQEIPFPIDTTVVTKHETNIRGQKISYTATTGMQPVWNEDREAIASLFYTYYERSDVKDKKNRPLVISFNGGPGSASVWMHIAYTGPRVLEIDPEGFPVQPYGIKENPNSILDVADIVYVNPVNTGYSRIVQPETGDEKKEIKKEIKSNFSELIQISVISPGGSIPLFPETTAGFPLNILLERVMEQPGSRVLPWSCRIHSGCISTG